MSILKATESEEQQALFQWAAAARGRFPELALMHHIPNGGKRDKVTAARLKAEGAKAGVPDIFLPVARGGKHGLYIEMKTESGVASKEQIEFINAVRLQGYEAVVCRGWVNAKACIEAYLRF